MTKRKRTNNPIIIIFAVACGIAGFFLGKSGGKILSPLSAAEMISLSLFFIPAFFIVIAVHEGGHALAGTLVRFDFRMYVVGPFMWEKEQAGWVFKWNTSINLAGGLVICLPSTSENLAKRFSVYAMGGPLASLILTAAAFAGRQVIAMMNYNQSTALAVAGSLLGLLGILSFVIFLVTAIPVRAGGLYSDGARTIRFLRGGDVAQFEILSTRILVNSTTGVRPRLLDIKELHEALNLAEKLEAPTGVYLHGYFYQIAFDLGNIDEAEVSLKNYIGGIDNIPDGMRGSVWLDATFFYAFARRDLEKAQYYWDKYVPAAILPKAQVLAAEAALLFVKNNFNEMDKKIESAIREIPNMMDKGVGIALEEKLIQLKCLKN